MGRGPMVVRKLSRTSFAQWIAIWAGALFIVSAVLALPAPAAASRAGAGPGALVGGNVTIPGYHVWVLTFDPSNGMMYGTVEGQTPANISVFNGTTAAFVKGIPAGSSALGYFTDPIGLDAAQSKVFVQETGVNGTGKIGQFSTTTLTDLPSHDYVRGCGGIGPTYDPKNGVLFLNCGKPSPTASIYEYIVNSTTLQLKFNVTLGTGAGAAYWGPGIDPRNGLAYQSMDVKNEIQVVSPYNGAIVATIHGLGYNLESPIFDPHSGMMYAVSESGAVDVIDPATQSVRSNFTLSGGAILSVSPMWATNELALLQQPSCSGCNVDQILYVNATSGAVIGNTSVAFGTAAIAYDPSDAMMWSTDSYGAGMIQLWSPIY
jgi:hypothetical protein